jgi:hypothetical protein
LPLLVGLFWLAVPGGRANAEFVLYTFNGTSNDNSVSLSGSFLVDTLTIPADGVLHAAALQADLNTPFTTTFQGNSYNVVVSTSTLTLDTNTFAILNANLNLVSNPATGQLSIAGSPVQGFNWTELTELGSVSGTGTFTSSQTAAVPAPPSLALLGLGALCAAGYAWRRRRLAHA